MSTALIITVTAILQQQIQLPNLHLVMSPAYYHNQLIILVSIDSLGLLYGGYNLLPAFLDGALYFYIFYAYHPLCSTLFYIGTQLSTSVTSITSSNS